MIFVFATGSLGPVGGQARFNSSRANYLVSKGHSAVVVAREVQGRPIWLLPSIPVYEYGSKREPWGRSSIRLRILLRSLKPDVVVANDSASALGAWGICPVLRYSHGGHALDKYAFIYHGPPGLRRLNGLLHHFSYLAADGVVANSRWCAQSFLARGVPVTFNYPGVDTDQFAPLDRSYSRHELQHSHLIPENVDLDCFLVLSVGLLRHVKRYDVVLSAFRVILRSESNAHLIIVGSGGLEHFLRDRVSQMGLKSYVTLVSSNPTDHALRLCYNAASVYVHAAEREHFGIPVAEAQACETAAVVPNQGGASEIVQDGETGLHFQAGNGQSLAEKAVFLARNPATAGKFGRSGRIRMLEHFDQHKMGKQFHQMVEQCLKPGKNGNWQGDG